MCALDWPRKKEYEVCPQCQEDTSLISNTEAMPDEEAQSLKNHLDFERYYERREAAKRTNVDPPENTEDLAALLEEPPEYE